MQLKLNSSELKRLNLAVRLKMKTFKILLIDAWADGDGWTWNDWYSVGTYFEDVCGELTEENALEFLRDNFIKKEHWDNVEIVDDQYNLVLVQKSDGEPLLAIEYGSEY